MASASMPQGTGAAAVAVRIAYRLPEPLPVDHPVQDAREDEVRGRGDMGGCAAVLGWAGVFDGRRRRATGGGAGEGGGGSRARSCAATGGKFRQRQRLC